MNPSILSYGCSSSAGSNVAAFWEILTRGEDRSTFITTENWPVRAQFNPKVFRSARIDKGMRQNFTARELLLSELVHAWREAQTGLSKAQQSRLKNAQVGVILASTKSFVDDFIWKPDSPQLALDAMTPLLNDFLRVAELNPVKTVCLSNACASSLSAIYLAKRWLESGNVSDVWVVAADLIGPFVLQGFHCLHALTEEKLRPFARNRSGLLLGDGAAAILLSALSESSLKLRGAGIETEGVSVTRPSHSGESLTRACLQIEAIKETPPNLIIAHGTATPLNDPAEDQAFSTLFGNEEGAPFVSATKGCIGHTLGASGAMDLIAACEVLKRQKAFCINNNSEVDPTFESRYLYKGHTHPIPQKLNGVLITSLGFGGVNAAAMVELV